LSVGKIKGQKTVKRDREVRDKNKKKEKTGQPVKSGAFEIFQKKTKKKGGGKGKKTGNKGPTARPVSATPRLKSNQREKTSIGRVGTPTGRQKQHKN